MADNRRAGAAEIERRYRRDHAGKSEPFSLLGILLNDFRAVLRLRHGLRIPESDHGLADLTMLARIIAARRGDNGRKWFRNIVDLGAPWLVPAVDRVWAEAASRLEAPTPDELSRHLKLTWVERVAAGVRNIPAFDVTGDDLKNKQRKRRADLARERKRRERAKRGARTRAEYEQNSLSARRSWEAEGISRRTWYRRQDNSQTASEKIAADIWHKCVTQP